MIEGFLFDIDGVLLHGADAIPGAVEALRTLVSTRFKVGYITNENQISRQACALNLGRYGFPVTADTMMTASAIAAQYASTELAARSVLVIGTTELRAEFADAGLRVISLDHADEAEVVVMGKDLDFNYKRLEIVANAVSRLGTFYATNLDARVPIGNGRFRPGTGAMIRAVAYAAGVVPIVLGKPSARAARLSAEMLGLAPDKLVMVGDAPAQDIAMGKAAGMFTVLVMTGVARDRDPAAYAEDQRPDLIVESVVELPGARIGSSSGPG